MMDKPSQAFGEAKGHIFILTIYLMDSWNTAFGWLSEVM